VRQWPIWRDEVESIRRLTIEPFQHLVCLRLDRDPERHIAERFACVISGRPLTKLLNSGQGKVAAFKMESGLRKHVQNLLLGYVGLEQAAVLINPANGEKR
jgi:hypothetical protein